MARMFTALDATQLSLVLGAAGEERAWACVNSYMQNVNPNELSAGTQRFWQSLLAGSPNPSTTETAAGHLQGLHAAVEDAKDGKPVTVLSERIPKAFKRCGVQVPG